MPSPRLAALRTLLAAHSPLDDTEAQHRLRMLALADAGISGQLDPFARSTFAPGHFTASSFVLGPELDTVLLILHAKLGFWMQPGGHIDASDPSVLAAGRRELAEETGLAALALWPDPATPGFLDLDIHPIPARKHEPDHEHFDLRFLFCSPTTQLTDCDEVRGAQWVRLDAFEGVRSDASVMRAVQRIRQRVARHRP
jgi:8-oxo-dGTP pyrophosphatase MutT (NUDIX family)